MKPFFRSKATRNATTASTSTEADAPSAVSNTQAAQTQAAQTQAAQTQAAQTQAAQTQAAQTQAAQTHGAQAHGANVQIASSQNASTQNATVQVAARVANVSSGAAVASASVKSAVAPVVMSVPICRIATFHLNGLGDLLFTLPALHAIREGFPGAKISAVVRPVLAPLLRDSPLVDEVLLRPKGGLSKQTSLLMQLRGRHIDLVVAFSQSRNTTMLAWSSGAPMRVGFSEARMEALLTHRVPKVGPPTIETHLDLARALGCHTYQHDYRGLQHTSPASVQKADALLDELGIQGPFVVAACEASLRRGIKEWPVEHWAQALDALSPRLPVVLVGTAPTTEVSSRMSTQVFDLGGRTDLPTLAALCGRARLFIGIDSGVMHLAASMGTPVVGIFGPSDWRLTSPRGVPHRIVRHPVECSPCLLSQCKWTGEDERKCLTRLVPNQVVEAARELIGV